MISARIDGRCTQFHHRKNKITKFRCAQTTANNVSLALAIYVRRASVAARATSMGQSLKQEIGQRTMTTQIDVVSIQSVAAPTTQRVSSVVCARVPCVRMGTGRRLRNAIIALRQHTCGIFIRNSFFSTFSLSVLLFRLRRLQYKLQISVYIGALSAVDRHRMQSFVSFIDGMIGE